MSERSVPAPVILIIKATAVLVTKVSAQAAAMVATLSSCRSFLRSLSGSPGSSRYASSQCHSTPGQRGDMRRKMQEI